MVDKESSNIEWWGYVHSSGSIQVKRYFSKLDIDEAKESVFVETVFGPFEADGREDAIQKLKDLII